jgi:hypothetical protein
MDKVNEFIDVHNEQDSGNDDDVYLDKLQTRGVKKYILDM